MKHYLSIVFLFLLFVACDPAAELGTPFHKGQEVVLTAAIGEQRPQMMPGMQRISGKDAPTAIDLLWDEGDEIRVHVGEASSVFTLIDGAGTANASFIGTMPASGSSFEVTYPKENNDDLLLQQTYVPEGIAKGLMKMSTASPGTLDDGFTLKAEHAVLGLQLTGNSEIGKLVLTRNAEKGATSVESYTLNCKLSNSKSSGVTLTETATLFYIVLPAGIWEKGFTVDVYAADNTTIIDTFVTNKSFEFTAANATTMAEKDVQDPPKRIGVFSVGAGKKVSFSQGNLQYTQNTDTWRFAAHQYDVIGTDNIQDGALADLIDLFGWSGNNTTALFGVSTSTNNADYAGEFVDWGVNTISGDAPDTWRTLSADEWEYLLKKRKNASDLYGVAQVAGINGMIILPDDWEEANGIVFKSGLHSSQVNDYSVYQSFTDAQWLAMENAGAVFLPALGYRDGTNVEKCNTSGYYWSNTTSDEESAYRLYFYSYFLAPNGVHSKYRGRSVRLVHDTIVPKVEPEYVDLGLSVKWATFNVGATSPEDYGDYFAWGETEPKETYIWATYKWCNGTENNITKYNTTDGKTILEPEDDAAHIHWGDKWRMPSCEESIELKDKCDWEWTTSNNINGYRVKGPNGNSIFLPAGGVRINNASYAIGEFGYYWSSSLMIDSISEAHSIVFTSTGKSCDSDFLYRGRKIRPVYDDRPKSKIIWYTDEAIKEGSNGASGTFMAGWAYLHPEGMETTELNRRYQGKRINCIRLQVAKAGTFTVSVANRDRLDSIFNIQTIMLKDPSKEPQVYHLPQTIHLQKNQVLVFANPTDQARFYYSSYVGDISFADYVGHPDQTVRITPGPKTLNIDAGYYCEDGENCDTLAIETKKIKPKII